MNRKSAFHPSDLIQYQLTGWRTRTTYCLIEFLAGAIVIGPIYINLKVPPYFLMLCAVLGELSLFNVFGELCECAIIALFIGVVIAPLLECLIAVECVFVFLTVGFALCLVRLVVRSEGFSKFGLACKRLVYLCFVVQFFVFEHVALVVVR